MRSLKRWVLLFALLLGGCPRLPEPDGCTPSAEQCRDGTPVVCSPSQRWTPANRPCTELGAVCCRTRSAYGGREIVACVPRDNCLAEDGGVP